MVLITGGSGFIGTNLADRLASSGRRVRLLDNLSRPGVENNLHWLRETHGDRVSIEIADVRDAVAVRRAVAGVETVFHFAAQVAVTTSLDDPIHDFDVNVRGTLNVLEAARAQESRRPSSSPPPTRSMAAWRTSLLRQRGRRYEPCDDDPARPRLRRAPRARGIGVLITVASTNSACSKAS